MVETVLIPFPKKILVGQIIEATCRRHGLTRDQLLRGGRSRAFSHPRQQVMWLADRLRPDVGFRVVARMLGLRDHTTIIHGVNAVYRRALMSDEGEDLRHIAGDLGVEVIVDERAFRLTPKEIARRSVMGRLSAEAKMRRRENGRINDLRMAG